METDLKIMVARDYSDAVMNAEHYAVQLAKTTGAELSLVHSYFVPFIQKREFYARAPLPFP